MDGLYKYKTEMHCHTAESSLKCGKIPAAEMVKIYEDAGYDTLLITDHYGGPHISGKGIEYDILTFMEGFNAAKAAAKKINVIQGMELRFHINANDYLVYGMTEEFVRKNPLIYEGNISEFMPLAHENGLLVYQAHPFRNNLTIVPPGICDGLEVYNSHPRHDSRNDIALAWAKKYNINMISGSDAHKPQDTVKSGIRTKEEIKNSAQLLEVLKSGDYQLITE